MEKNVKALLIDGRDNVAVALEDIPGGATVDILGTAGRTLRAERPIPFAHKIAITPIASGDAILKYGVPIGFAMEAIVTGAWVHEHNAKSYYAAKREAKSQ